MSLLLQAPLRVGDLAERYGGSVDAAARERAVNGVAPVQAAGFAELAPVLAARFLEPAVASDAALLVDATLASRLPEGARWIHPHAPFALASLLEDLVAPGLRREESTDAGAPRGYVSPGAEVHPSVRIGPGAMVLGGARLGPGCRVEPNAVIYDRVQIGSRVLVGASAVIGRAGFGWVHGPDGALRRMPQLGGVVIEDDVEIGPLCSIDAGTLGPTVLRRGAKLDAQVHVGHNVDVGEWVLVAAQSGFAGSVRIGERTLVGGQAGVADHVIVGAGARLAAKAGVIGDVPPGHTVAGYPAIDRVRWLRAMARLLKFAGRSK